MIFGLTPKTVTVKCPLCDSEQHKTLFRIGTKLFPMNIACCRSCGFVFQNPRVAEEAWNDYYEQGVYDRFHRPRPMQGAESSNNRASNETFERIMAFLSRWSSKLDDRMLNPGIEHPATKVCEIGAGQGTVIDAFCGMERYAIEPSQECGNILSKKGITVLAKTEAGPAFEKRMTFDILIMRHVLEHIYWPKHFLNGINDLLSKKGILYIAVPNFLCPSSMASFTYPHISYFTPQALRILLQTVGLEVAEMISEGDEIWCITQKRAALNQQKFNLTTDRVSESVETLMLSNLQETMNHIDKSSNSKILLKRRAMRWISYLLPRQTLLSIYERR